MRGGRPIALATLVLAIAASALLGGGSAVGAASSSSPTYSFVAHAIPTAPYDQVERANNAADINGDGRPDLVVAGEKYLVWYENPPNQESPGAVWPAHKIANGVFGIASLVAIRDLTGEGRPDIVVGETVRGATVPRQMAWFENKTSGWVRHTLSGSQSCHHLDFGDLNGDGRVDIACSGGSSEHVVWLEQPANILTAKRWAAFEFDERPIWGSRIVDVDRDGLRDIVAGRAWYRNPGLTPSSSGTQKRNWVRYPYTLQQDTAVRDGWAPSYFDDLEEINVLDLNNDGRLDVVASLFGSSPEAEVHAYLAPADPRSSNWTDVVLDAGPLFSVHTQALADYDASGRPQIAVGEMAWAGYGFGHNPAPTPGTDIAIYRLEGHADDASAWHKYTIATDDIGTHAADAIDINGDGRIDLISGEENSGNGNPVQNGRPRWWENQTEPGPPSNIDKPVISGDFRANEPVTATDGNWAGATSFSRQWFSCDPDNTSDCAPISGETASSFTPGSGEIGRRLVITVTAHNAAGSDSATSDPSPVVQPGFSGPPTNTGLPTISAPSFQAGSAATGTDGSWQEATSFSRQWTSCAADGTSDCQPVAGATTNTLALGDDLVGRTVRFDVTAHNSIGSTPAQSAVSPVIIGRPNRAPDPSFEVSPKTYYYGNGTGQFTISNTVFHTGTHSWAIDGNGTGIKRVISRHKYISALPGELYTASAWLKTASMDPSAIVCLQMYFYNSAGSLLSKTNCIGSLSGTNDWTKLSLSATSPDKTDEIRIDAVLDKGAGNVWYDDLYVTGPASPPHPVGSVSIAPGDGKLTISWTKPNSEFDTIRVVRKVGSDPADPGDGTSVYIGTGKSVVDTGVINGQEYRYGVWAERGGDFSTPVYAAGTPLAPVPVTYSAQPTGAYDSTSQSFTVGAVFHVTLASTITRLGKFFQAGSTGANTIGLWDDATQNLLFSATISPGAPAVDFPPIALTANKRYVIGIKEASGTPWSKSRTLTGLPQFLVVDDSAFVNGSSLTFPSGRDGQPGTSNEDWTMTLIPGGSLTPVDPVTNVQVAPGDSRVDLTWTNPGTFDSVLVVRNDGAPPTDPSDGTLVCACTGNSAADTGLTNGEDYYYGLWVTRGSGAYSVPARVVATPAAPAPVTYTATPTGTYGGTAANRVLGAVFHVTAARTLTQVGKVFKAGSTASNTIGIWDETTQTLLFSAVVSPASPTADITPGLALNPGQRYVLGIKEATGSPWSGGRLLTGLPFFLTIDDSVFLTSSSFAYPTGRDNKPGFSNEDWTMTFVP